MDRWQIVSGLEQIINQIHVSLERLKGATMQ
jgi:hypothetical protein